MAYTREQYLYMAKLAEQAERYEEMVEFMDKLVVSAASGELTVEERNLLSVAYKNVIGSVRAAWRIISSIEQKEESRKNDDHVSLVKDYRSRVEAELSQVCARILKLLSDNIIPSASSSESKVFYLKMKGDYYRYLAEFKLGDERKEAGENTLLAYKAAQDIALVDLAPTHPIRLGLALNFSVFYYEIMNSAEKACSMAKQKFPTSVNNVPLYSMPPADYYAAMGDQFMMLPPFQVFFPPPSQPSSESRQLRLGGSASGMEAAPPFTLFDSQFPPHSIQTRLEQGKDNADDDDNECVDGSRSRNNVKVSWSKEEDICFTNAWTTISNCSKDNAQKDKDFWKRTAVYFNENRPEGTPNRDWKAVKSHYYCLIPHVNTFSGWYNNFYSNRASGESDFDILEATNAKWRSTHSGKDFKYMHIWRVLKELEKPASQQMEHHVSMKSWSECGGHTSTNPDTNAEMHQSCPMGQQMEHHVSKKLRTSKCGGNTSTNPDTNAEMHQSCPMGQQRAKEKGKTKVKEAGDQSCPMEQQRSKEQAETKVKEGGGSLEKCEKIQHYQEQKMKQKEIEIEHRDYDFLMMDTSQMSNEHREWHFKIVEKIKARHGLT